PWVINAADLQTDLHLRAVYLLNDLEALANAVPILAPADLHTINPGTPVAGGAQAVVAPGTGLGEAFLTWDGARYQAHPSGGRQPGAQSAGDGWCLPGRRHPPAPAVDAGPGAFHADLPAQGPPVRATGSNAGPHHHHQPGPFDRRRPLRPGPGRARDGGLGGG